MTIVLLHAIYGHRGDCPAMYCTSMVERASSMGSSDDVVGETVSGIVQYTVVILLNFDVRRCRMSTVLLTGNANQNTAQSLT